MMGRRLWILAATAVLAGACSTPHGSEGIGVNRVGLTLAFADQALSTGPVPPQVIIKLIPAPPSLPATPQALAQYAVPVNATAPTTTTTTLAPIPTGTAPPPPPECATAPKGTPAPPAAPLAPTSPPAEGYYRIFNNGTEKVTADGIALQFPYPKVTVMQISNVKQSASSSIEGQGSIVVSFTETTTVTPKDVITANYQYSPSEIDLVSRSENNSGTVSADTFSPPIKIYESQGTGATFDSIGLDLANSRVMNFQGSIKSKPVVDACGALLATYAVTSKSSLIDSAHDTQSGTTAGATDVTDVATGVGGLFAYQQLDDTAIEQVNGAPVTIETQVTSTLDGHAPRQTPPTTS